MDPVTMSTKYLTSMSMRATIVCAAAAMWLAACESSTLSDDCAMVSTEHLSVPRDGGGEERICSPMRVAPAYRQQYFPGSSR